jgi:hypothetical protein
VLSQNDNIFGDFFAKFLKVIKLTPGVVYGLKEIGDKNC